MTGSLEKLTYHTYPNKQPAMKLELWTHWMLQDSQKGEPIQYPLHIKIGRTPDLFILDGDIFDHTAYRIVSKGKSLILEVLLSKQQTNKLKGINLAGSNFRVEIPSVTGVPAPLLFQFIFYFYMLHPYH